MREIWVYPAPKGERNSKPDADASAGTWAGTNGGTGARAGTGGGAKADGLFWSEKAELRAD